MADISKIKPNGSSGTEYDIKDATARSALENKANNTQTFTEASTRANIVSGETMSTLFGKIKKFFTDLKTVAFTGSYNDLSNKPTIPAAQVQSNWTQTTTTAVDYIKNKPTIPAAVAVKGNAESSYRTGNVNLTAANIGAIALSGTTALAGEITPKTNAAYNLGDLSHAFNYAHFKYLRLMGSIDGIIGTIKNSNDNQITLVMPSRTVNPSTGSYYSEENIATREYLNSKFVVEAVTFSSITIAVNDRGVFSKNVAKTGYTPIAFAGIALSNNWLSIVSWYLNDTTAQVILYNMRSAAQSVYPIAYILYKKD